MTRSVAFNTFYVTPTGETVTTTSSAPDGRITIVSPTAVHPRLFIVDTSLKALGGFGFTADEVRTRVLASPYVTDFTLWCGYIDAMMAWDIQAKLASVPGDVVRIACRLISRCVAAPRAITINPEVPMSRRCTTSASG